MNNHIDRLGRRSRIIATATGKRISPTHRDLLWFQKLDEHGPLPSSFLLAYAKHSHASAKRATERLSDLFHEDNTLDDGPYLARPAQQFCTIDSRYNQLVYDLAPAGRRALRRTGFDPNRYGAPSGPWLHRFMTACITASVELATLERSDISYIPQSAILARAQTALRCPLSLVDVRSGRALKKDIIPDAIFGLRYNMPAGDRFRFFAVEADRATEPINSGHWNRKSFERSLLQYDTYVAGGAYKQHLKLTAPLLVLHVLSDQQRMRRMIDFTAKRYPDGNTFMLFQSLDAFGPAFRPPCPQSSFLMGDWGRGGLPSFCIGEL